MKDCCDLPHNDKPIVDQTYRKILWIALILNAFMFFAEIASSFYADSVSLRADAIDFFGDAANYGVSLYVLGLALRFRSYASLLKAGSMGIFGFWVMGTVIYNALTGAAPHAPTMTIMGISALVVNLAVAMMLYKYRDGDSNMRSVWLCTRNDAIGNIAVVIAALGVYFTASMWPDLVIAAGMGALSIHSSYLVISQVRQELLHVDNS